jgi:hypothetical protein
MMDDAYFQLTRSCEFGLALLLRRLDGRAPPEQHIAENHAGKLAAVTFEIVTLRMGMLRDGFPLLSDPVLRELDESFDHARCIASDLHLGILRELRRDDALHDPEKYALDTVIDQLAGSEWEDATVGAMH